MVMNSGLFIPKGLIVIFERGIYVSALAKKRGY